MSEQREPESQPSSMEDQQSTVSQSVPQHTDTGTREGMPLSRDPKRMMVMIGYIMLTMSSFLAVVTVIEPLLSSRLSSSSSIPPSPDQGSEMVWFIQHYSSDILSVVFVIFLSTVGLQLLGAAGKTTPRVIPDEDRNLLEPLVREAKKEAIHQYVILSSLSGFTGTFQKIGFSGLPLATAVLTLLFCGLSFANPEFIEFAKLTLGAFIGSFVQRSADAQILREAKESEQSSAAQD